MEQTGGLYKEAKMSYRPYSAIIGSITPGSVKFKIQNSTGFTIATLTPITSNGSGQAKLINPSVEADVLKIVGITGESIASGSSGFVYSQGKIENITSPLSLGDYVYLSKTGQLTSTLPSEGVGGFVSGDFVVKLGVVVANDIAPAQKDLLVAIEIVGQV
jgi:hypothetical protein